MARETGGAREGFAIRGGVPPVHRKHCTDWYCCLLFIVFLIGLLGLAGFGARYGDLSKLDRLVRGRDMDGRLCGKDSGVEDFPLTYFSLQEGQAKPAKWTEDSRTQMKVVCTKSCPQSNPSSNISLAREDGLCAANMYPDWCTWYGAKTVRFADYCLDPVVFINISGEYQSWLNDLRAAIYHLAAIFPVSIIIGLIYLTTMEKCGGLFVWCVIFLVIVLPAGIGGWLYHDATTNAQLETVSIDADHEKMIAYGFWVLSGIFVLITLCSLKSIHGVATVVKATSQFLKDVPSQFLQPVIFGLVHLVVMAAWSVILFFVLSVDLKEGDTTECLADKDFVCMKWNKTTAGCTLVFLLLMIFWILNFLHACSHFGTAFAVREWYFTKPDETGVRRPEIGGHTFCDCKLTVTGVRTGLWHHSGSFAFGSLCISICKVIRLLLFWVSKDEEARSTNPVLKCVLRCANCIADCIERFVKFISEHAYVEMALQGHGFCKSAQEAMGMAVKKPVLFAITDNVALLVKVLGVALITIVGAYVVRLTLGWWKPDGLQSTVPPVIAAAVFCLFIGEIMMHPFTAAARASLHCVVVEEGNEVCQHEHTPQQLQRFVEDHDRPADPEQARRCCC